MNKFIAFLTGFLVTFFGAILVVLLIAYFTGPSTYNVLVIGSDQRGTERARSDVLFVVSVPKNGDKNPFFLSIPRDTKIEHEEWGLQKITHFYALGDRPDDGKSLGNVELTQEVVEDLLGISIDATAEVTFSSFEELIDELDGVPLNGATANGAEALAVVRDRFTDDRSDFDRQDDSREVFRALLTKMKTPATAEEMLQYFADADQARLRYKKIKAFRFVVGAGIARGGSVEIGEMEEDSVPGESARIYTPDFAKELYYWIPDEEALNSLVDEKLR